MNHRSKENRLLLVFSSGIIAAIISVASLLHSIRQAQNQRKQDEIIATLIENQKQQQDELEQQRDAEIHTKVILHPPVLKEDYYTQFNGVLLKDRPVYDICYIYWWVGDYESPQLDGWYSDDDPEFVKDYKSSMKNSSLRNYGESIAGIQFYQSIHISHFNKKNYRWWVGGKNIIIPPEPFGAGEIELSGISSSTTLEIMHAIIDGKISKLTLAFFYRPAAGEDHVVETIDLLSWYRAQLSHRLLEDPSIIAPESEFNSKEY